MHTLAYIASALVTLALTVCAIWRMVGSDLDREYSDRAIGTQNYRVTLARTVRVYPTNTYTARGYLRSILRHISR